MIRAREVRVIASDGEQLGVMPVREAIAKAEELGLDLVEVAAAAVPPVCRIMDFGKYKYELNKKAHESKKHQTLIAIKEIKLRPRTDDHDIAFKLNNIKRFIGEGNKVKVSVMFRGREMAHQQLGRAVLDRLIQELQGIAIVEQQARMEGRNMFLMLAPVKKQADRESDGTKKG